MELSIRGSERERREWSVGRGVGEFPSGKMQQDRRQHGKGSRNTWRTWPAATKVVWRMSADTALHCSGRRTSSLRLEITGLRIATGSLCLTRVNSARRSGSDAVGHDSTLRKQIGSLEKTALRKHKAPFHVNKTRTKTDSTGHTETHSAHPNVWSWL